MLRLAGSLSGPSGYATRQILQAFAILFARLALVGATYEPPSQSLLRLDGLPSHPQAPSPIGVPRRRARSPAARRP